MNIGENRFENKASYNKTFQKETQIFTPLTTSNNGLTTGL